MELPLPTTGELSMYSIANSPHVNEHVTVERPRRALLAAVAGMLMSVAVSQAQAGLVLVPTETFAGGGIGSVNTILTMQSPGSSSVETAGVGVDALTNLTVVTGDAKTGASQTQVRTLTELGIDAASALRVVFNPNEPGGNSITLTNLVLSIYSPTGSLLFSSGAFAPVSFASTSSGIGNPGFVFGLDAADAAAAQAAAFSGAFGANRVGLTASASSATGGFETLSVASAVPEPSSWAMIGAGLVASASLLRRRKGKSGPA